MTDQEVREAMERAALVLVAEAPSPFAVEMWTRVDALARDLLACRVERDAAREALREADRMLTVFHDRLLSPSERVMARGEVIKRVLDGVRTALGNPR